LFVIGDDNVISLHRSR